MKVQLTDDDLKSLSDLVENQDQSHLLTFGSPRSDLKPTSSALVLDPIEKGHFPFIPRSDRPEPNQNANLTSFWSKEKDSESIVDPIVKTATPSF